MKTDKWLFLAILFSFAFLFLSYIPNLYEASIVDLLPENRQMVWGEHIYTYDYNIYLSKIRQGIEGRWNVVDKYDNNIRQKGVFLQMLYLLSGKAGGLLRLTPPLIFHLLRTIASFIWVWTIIYINFYFLNGRDAINRVTTTIGILFSLLAASFPVFYRYNNQLWVGNHMAWWTEMDVLKRISYIPHYTLNYIIIAILSVLLSKLSKSQIQSSNVKSNLKSKVQIKNNFFGFWILKLNWILDFEIRIFLLISVLLFLSFFIHPASGILFLFSWFIFHLIEFIYHRSSAPHHLPKIIFQTLILFAVTAVPLLYFQEVTSTYPWKSLTDFDKFFRYPVDVREYILALGPIFFTGILGGIVVLIKRDLKYLSLVSWILGAFAGIYLFKKFPYASELRFVQTANHIPLAILSVYFIQQLLLSFRRSGATEKSKSDVKSDRNLRFARFLAIARNNIVRIVIFVIVFSIITLGLIQNYFSVKSQTQFIREKVVAGQPLVPYPPQVMYPLKDFWNAINWLEANTSDNDVVLSQVTAGNFIPAYSGNFVYLGHNPETPLYDKRSEIANRFFSGQMAPEDAQNFLKKENISYIFYGPQEWEKSVKNIKEYSFLAPAYTSLFVTLFKVK